MKNLFVVGAQSTGKSTIVNALKHELALSGSPLSLICHGNKPAFIREVARNLLTAYNFTHDDIVASPEWALQLQRHILDAQIAAENASLHQSPNSWFISDRSGLDPIVYAAMFVGEMAAEELLPSTEWRSLERRMKDGIVFLREAGTLWLVDDGTRMMPRDTKEWFEMDACFHRMLQARGIDYMVIPKSVHEVDELVAIVTEALRGSVEN